MNRNELKNAICTYFTASGVDRSNLPKILKVIKEIAGDFAIKLDKEEIANFDKKTQKYINDAGLNLGEEFYYRVSWNFAPSHYATVVGFADAYLDILASDAETEAQIESEIQDAIAEEYNWDEHLYDELGGPEAAIVLFTEYIEVRAYQKGVGNSLPKQGRKYVGSPGDVRWHFPLTSLDSLKKLGFPMVDRSVE